MAKDARAVAESEAACHAFLAEHGKTGVFIGESLVVLSDGVPIAEYGAM